jgi:hypothetical protein
MTIPNIFKQRNFKTVELWRILQAKEKASKKRGTAII